MDIADSTTLVTALRSGHDRALGRPFVARMLPANGLDVEILAGRSQRMLAGGVFVARLFPFISFDAVSYAAGLTPLRAWLFASATFVGMVPMTLLFAHMGVAMTTEEGPQRALNLSCGLGAGRLGVVWMEVEAPPDQRP